MLGGVTYIAHQVDYSSLAVTVCESPLQSQNHDLNSRGPSHPWWFLFYLPSGLKTDIIDIENRWGLVYSASILSCTINFLVDSHAPVELISYISDALEADGFMVMKTV